MADEAAKVKPPRTPKAKAPPGTKTQAATAAPVETTGTQRASTQAPPMFRQQFRQQLAGTQITDQGGVDTPLPIPLPDIDRDFGPLVQNLKQVMQEHYQGLPPEEQNGYFAQGFNQYPEAMAQMLVRRALNNRIRAQGDVAKWMELVNQRFK